MGIFNEFHKKEKPVFTGSRFGFGAGAGGSTASTAVTGGTVVDGITDGSYTYYVFTTDTPAPQSELVVPYQIPAPKVMIMAIGGGGGGGSGHAGGGGAGALILLPAGSSTLPAGTYPVTIGAGGDGGSGPPTNNLGTDGVSTVFGDPGTNYYIVAGGGGRGGGWNAPDSRYIGPAPGPGGSGGGITGDGTTNTYPAPAISATPTGNRFNGNATQYANLGGQSNNGSPVSRGGTGGGGAGTRGQGTEPSPPNTNPTSIPTTQPTYPFGTRTGLNPFPGSPADMATAPNGSAMWPGVSATSLAGAWGGHGLSVPEFPAPVLSPAIPSPQQTAFTTEVTANGYYAAGGGGGSHAASMNTPNGGGLGGIGGGGQGGRHSTPNTNGIAATYGTGSGGGGSGSQPNLGGAGAAGVVFIRIEA